MSGHQIDGKDHRNGDSLLNRIKQAVLHDYQKIHPMFSSRRPISAMQGARIFAMPLDNAFILDGTWGLLASIHRHRPALASGG
jgi:hypothetical protein